MKISVTSISRDELVTLFSDSTYGSNWLTFNSKEVYGAILPTNMKNIKEEHEKEHSTYCREDKWADILLNGGTLVAVDFYDKDEDGEYGRCYPITLANILNGLTKAQKECPYNFANVAKFDGSADYFDANNVMQCIIFGEVIYG